MKVFLFLFLSVCCTGCVLLSPVSYREIPLEQLPWPAQGDHFSYCVEILNPLTGSYQKIQVEPGSSCIVPLEKTGCSYVLIFPQGYREPFSPKALGGIMDPQQQEAWVISPAGGVAVSLFMKLHRLGLAHDFNFSRLDRQIREDLGNRAWQLNLEDLTALILAGECSSRAVRLSDPLVSSVLFDPGNWICDDPGQKPLVLENPSLVDISLMPGGGLRYLELEQGLIKEIYCSQNGRFLIVDIPGDP